jgi:site-specific recombinase XerD
MESVKRYLEESAADNTRRAYAGQWRRFERWCSDAGLRALPATAATVSAYLARLADDGKRDSTIEGARAAIRKTHEAAGEDDPTAAALVKQTLKGIRRQCGVAVVQKSPILTTDLRRLLGVIPGETLKGKRDRALLLLGFALASRRSELVSLDVADIEDDPRGLLVTIRRSKTDQEGKGIVKGIVRGEQAETCPVSALREWLQAAGITAGPVFRRVARGGHVGERLTAQSVALVLKAACRAAGLDIDKYSGHSLRAGMVTQAAKNGVTVADIMRQTGHRSTETVNKYIRKSSVFEDNASARLGL